MRLLCGPAAASGSGGAQASGSPGSTDASDAAGGNEPTCALSA
ncbi:hypothetical protein [Mycobacterium asiaticum]|nr:hypothetical protein [Mycobacterium asiaticum]